MKKRRKKVILPSLIVAATILIFTCLYFGLIWPVKPIATELSVELGAPVSTTITDYVSGNAHSIKQCILDISKVNTNAAGDYPITITQAFRHMEILVHVTDSTVPTLVAIPEPIYLASNTAYELSDLFESIYDNSGKVYLSYLGEDSISRTTFFSPYSGEETIVVTATDPSGNSANQEFHLIIDTPPRFRMDNKDIYFATGSEYNLLDGITAYDLTDGDLTAHIESNIDEIDLTKDGTYKLQLRVADQYGLLAKEMVNIYVKPAMEIQELINTKQISRHNETIIGAYNLYDGGALENDDITAALDHIRPAVVAVTSNMNGSTSRGSGYIVSVDDERVLIFTNNHVIRDPRDYRAEFYDGSVIPCKVLATNTYGLGGTDIALVSVDMKLIPESLKENLVTIHINKGHWESLKDNPNVDVGVNIKGDSNGYRADNKLTGKLVQIHGHEATLEPGGAATEYDLDIYGGTSGSAIVDGHGNLISMIVGSTYYTKDGKSYSQKWGVPLDNLLEFYEKTTGKALNYE